MVMHIIKDVLNDQNIKAQEEMKDLEISWEVLDLSNLSPIFIILLIFPMHNQHKEPLFKALCS